MFFPHADFSVIGDWPEIYNHCKATEDKDLNLIEFITEHVSPIGQLIECVEHDMGDNEDKPHVPMKVSSLSGTVMYCQTMQPLPLQSCYQPYTKPITGFKNKLFSTHHLTLVFRPPIVS